MRLFFSVPLYFSGLLYLAESLDKDKLKLRLFSNNWPEFDIAKKFILLVILHMVVPINQEMQPIVGHTPHGSDHQPAKLPPVMGEISRHLCMVPRILKQIECLRALKKIFLLRKRKISDKKPRF